MLTYTSGTTGNPKGAVHTHGSLEAMMTSMTEAWQWTEHDHICNTLPLHHVHGIMNVLNTALWSGAHCTMIPKFDNRTVWDILLDDEDGIDFTLFMAVPTIYNKLIEYYEAEGLADRATESRAKLKHLRLMVSGSSPLTHKTFNRWQEITGHTLLERFGMTEVGMALTNPCEDVNGRLPGHVGHPFPGVEAAFLDFDGETIHQDMDKEAELLIRSPCMFDRYYNSPEATEKTFHTDPSSGQRWFRTGDCAV